MNVLVGTIFVLTVALSCFVKCEDINGKNKRKRFLFFSNNCHWHDDCPPLRFCDLIFKQCKHIPPCIFGHCPIGLICSKKICVKPRYCDKLSSCDSDSECCKRKLLWRKGYCKKLPGKGKHCQIKAFDPCKRCSPGHECISFLLNEGTCHVETPVTKKAPTKKPSTKTTSAPVTTTGC